MFEWMSPFAFLQTVVRVMIVWSAFYTVGYFLWNPLRVNHFLPLLPRELLGVFALSCLAVILSIFGVMTRGVLGVIVMVLAIPGFFLVFHRFLELARSWERSLFGAFFLLFFIFIVSLNVFYASLPNLQFDDPLITYAVQPDRWLNAGRIFWLHETAFSGFPLTYEIAALWPASLSTDRVDQISVLQVFQMSILILALFRTMQLIRAKRELRIPVATIVMMCTMLLYWCSLAKNDTLAVLFCSLSLAAAIRELEEHGTKPWTSWFLMGAALGTKQTAILVLIPFIILTWKRFFTGSVSSKLISLIAIAIIPGVFAIRTASVTGSPVYPYKSLDILVHDEWRRLPLPQEIVELNDRASAVYESSEYGLLKHVGIFLTSMEGIFLLLLAGISYSLIHKNRDVWMVLPLLLYFIVAFILFWPPWWGAKYSILIYPFTGILGAKLLCGTKQSSKWTLALVAMISFIIPGFVIGSSMVLPFKYRSTIAISILESEWDDESEYSHLCNVSPEEKANLWLNSYEQEPCRILSLFEEKRYFSNHEVYVGWRHPLTQPIYLENTLEEECEILNNLGIKYVTFNRINPLPGELEDKVELLRYIGTDNVLEPVVVFSGYLVARYNSP